MTNETRQAPTTKTTARRTRRAVTVAAGAAGALLVWTVADALAGVDVAVRQGGAVQRIGPVAVVVTALIAGLAAWALLALLERTTGRAVRTYRIIASVVLIFSLAGPLGSGEGAGSRMALLGMHLVVGVVLIALLPGRRTRR
ncbi:DUF6069 family protein [Actinoplanes sp. CA-030573]|uniref:DUF6069 family protein n=1 Tax=Actinoplanes sp. CA-030573 TaxID=3239898 RepID=UPI003D89B8F7